MDTADATPKSSLFVVNSLPARWYRRINLLTTAFSVLLVVTFLIFEFLWAPLGGNQFFGLTWSVAILATAHALFAQVVFPLALKRWPDLGGVISFCLFITLAAFLVHTTQDEGTQFIVVWVVTLFLSGLFGSFLLVALSVLNVIYLGTIFAGWIAAPSDFNITLLILTLLTSAASGMLWKKIREDPPSNVAGANASGKFIKEKVDTDILTSALADGVVIINDKQTIQMFNPAAQQITGWDGKDALGLDIKSVLPLMNEQGVPYLDDQNPFLRCLATGESVRDDRARLKTRSEKLLEVSVIVSPIKSDANTVAAAVGVFRDVSAERDQERQRAEFISTASHEMRTPVAAIEGYLALALNDRVSKIDSVARGYLDKAHSSTQHLGKLFQDLLTAAKSEDGRLTNHPKVVEVGQFLDELTESVRFTAEKKGLSVEYHPEGGMGAMDARSAIHTNVVRPIYYIYADPDRLREVVTNIFDNAVKYTEEGKVTIGMGTEENNIVLTVSDTGPGIPKEDIPHLFQKFYRVDNTATRQVGGTGLGLFICRKIIELYNGRIWVDSELGKGSNFHISIPRLDAEKAKEMMKLEAAQPLADEDLSGALASDPYEKTEEATTTTPQPGTAVTPTKTG